MLKYIFQSHLISQITLRYTENWHLAVGMQIIRKHGHVQLKFHIHLYQYFIQKTWPLCALDKRNTQINETWWPVHLPYPHPRPQPTEHVVHNLIFYEAWHTINVLFVKPSKWYLSDSFSSYGCYPPQSEATAGDTIASFSKLFCQKHDIASVFSSTHLASNCCNQLCNMCCSLWLVVAINRVHKCQEILRANCSMLLNVCYRNLALYVHHYPPPRSRSEDIGLPSVSMYVCMCVYVRSITPPILKI